LVGALFIVVFVAVGLAVARPAQAVPTPIYNAPVGGGPVTEVVETVGPFTLDAQGGAHWQDESENLVPRPAGAYGIKYATFDLVDQNDQSIPRQDVHLHHFVIGALNKPDVACPDRTVAGFKVEPLIGTGMERTPISFEDPYALPVGTNDKWGALWHLMNMTNTSKTFWVKYTLGIQYGATSQNTRWVSPFWADSRSCPAGETWNVPGNGGVGSVETDTKAWTMPFDGYLVAVGGHVHEGGLSITTTHQDGSLICENDATYANGMLDKISGCTLHDTITAGEQVSVSSRYDNSSPHDDVMGIAVLFLWQGDQGPPPTTSTTTSTSTSTSSTTTTVDPPTTTTTVAPAPAVAATAVSADPSFAG
jgi:hypothetical protein